MHYNSKYILLSADLSWKYCTCPSFTMFVRIRCVHELKRYIYSVHTWNCSETYGNYYTALLHSSLFIHRGFCPAEQRVNAGRSIHDISLAQNFRTVTLKDEVY